MQLTKGPIACTRIKINKGVCGTSWFKKETIIVPDVDKFPGHIGNKLKSNLLNNFLFKAKMFIACSSLSKSEIVVPVFSSIDKTSVFGVLDVDSEHLEHFDETDKEFLEQICQLITLKLK